MTRLAHLIATVFGVGLLRPAPGTWGSLAALPFGWLLHQAAGFPGLLLGLLTVFFCGWWATSVATRGSENHDPSEIVVDEVAGQLVALIPLSYPAWAHGIDITVLWPGWIAAFVLFRIFDIIKRGPVGWADRRGDALGVMLDDIFAGIFAAIGVVLLAGFAHGVLGF